MFNVELIRGDGVHRFDGILFGRSSHRAR
jgi:hypothetical protein